MVHIDPASCRWHDEQSDPVQNPTEMLFATQSVGPAATRRERKREKKKCHIERKREREKER
jgi:hypothetical protein